MPTGQQHRLTAKGVFCDTDTVSFIKGNSVTLQTGITKQQYEVIRWYFNAIHIAQFDQDVGESCLYDGEGEIFRDRLEVDYETGSLTITNTTTEHAGHYEADIIRRQHSGSNFSFHISSNCDSTKIIQKKESFADSTKTFILTDNSQSSSVPGSGLSAAAAVGISAAVLLVFAAAVGVIFYRRSIRKCPTDNVVRFYKGGSHVI